MKRLALGLAAGMAFAGLACGAPAAREPTVPVAPTADPVVWDRAVETALTQLSAIDARLGVRTRRQVSETDLRRIAMEIIVQGDAQASIVMGGIDPFSFEARRTALHKTRKDLEVLAAPQNRQAEREELLALVDEELARVDEESRLPGSASELVLALGTTWSAPKSPSEAEKIDAWLVRRLSEIAGSIRDKGLGEPQRTELDDSLDTLEAKALSGAFPKSAAELIKLRELLESDHKPSVPSSADLEQSLKAHGGGSPGLTELATRFERARDQVGALLAQRTLSLRHEERDKLATDVYALLTAPGPCAMPGPGAHNQVRALGAPPERAPMCHSLLALAKANAPWTELVAATAVHEHLCLARHALPGPKPRECFLSPQPIERSARLLRAARAHRTRAVVSGLMAEVLTKGALQARAVAWLAQGDITPEKAPALLPSL
jgi:hypothetical protein